MSLVRLGTLATLTAGVMLAGSLIVSAQGRGGGGGGGFSSAPRPRFAVITEAFTLDDAQRKQIKSILDAEHKNAEPLRKALVEARDTIGAGIEANQSATEMDAAVQAYAAHAAALAHAEMRALAQVVKALNEQQRANQAAIELTFHYMRGALFDKKWDSAPGGRGY
jgi:hypothetical protein